jgi:hypothetical protein
MKAGWVILSILLYYSDSRSSQRDADFVVNYSATSGGALTTWTDSSSHFSCGLGFHGDEKIRGKGETPLSINNNISSWPDTCKWLKQWAGIHPTDEVTAKLQYDTLRMYIERCGQDQFSYSVFGNMDGAVQYMSADTNRFLPYRVWLISVLYLNTSQNYFCACMGSIANTFQFGKNAYLGRLAVMNYLRTAHPECWGPGLDKEYAKDSAYDVNAGFDVNHLPPLDSLGLGFLLKSGVPSPGTTLSESYLASFTSNPNPFKDETRLQFHLNRMTYATIGIYDILGHQVWGDGKGHSYEAGDHEIGVEGASLPDGLLYARISTGFGEVKTVKLVKE